MNRKALRLALAAVPVLMTGSVSLATTIYSTGFESPTFSTGNLAGQDTAHYPASGIFTAGWNVEAPASSQVQVVLASSIPGGTPTGWQTQAVQLTRTGTQSTTVTGVNGNPPTINDYSDDIYAYNYPNYTVAAPNTIVNVNWSNVTETSTSQTASYGPFVGVEANDDSLYQDEVNNSVSPTNIVVGAFGVDASTGELEFSDAVGEPDTLPDIIGGTYDPTITLGSAHNFSISLNYTAQTYTAYLDGTAIATLPFSTDAKTYDANQMTDADLVSLQNDADVPNLNDVSYFDNYSITAVPEPTPFGLLGLAGLVFLAHRRRGYSRLSRAACLA